MATDRSGTDLLTVVGRCRGCSPGRACGFVGRWGSQQRYGRQFEVDSFTTILPATMQGIERHLGSGLIKGSGRRWPPGSWPISADTLRAIEKQPGRLVGVPGLSLKRTAMNRCGVAGAEGHQGE